MELNEIIKVKIQGQGYPVNDEMSVPKADGNRHYELVKEWLLTNTPEPEFTPEQLDARRIAQIKSISREAPASIRKFAQLRVSVFGPVRCVFRVIA